MNLDIVNYGIKSFEDGLPAIAIAKEVDKDAAKTFCMVKVNGVAKEMFYQPQDGDKLEFLTFDDPDGLAAPISWPRRSSIFSLIPNSVLARLSKTAFIMMLIASTFLLMKIWRQSKKR